MARQCKVSGPTVSRILAGSRVTGEVTASEGPGDERIVGILPVAALDERLAIVGTAGSGKTDATKGLERLMQAGASVCVVDSPGSGGASASPTTAQCQPASPSWCSAAGTLTSRSGPAWARHSAGWSEGGRPGSFPP